MMKPRVAIVLPYFGSGGAENMVSRLASHIDLSRVDAEVICIYGKPQNNRLEKEIEKHGVPIKFIGKGKGFSLKAISKLWQELSAFKPTVVHTHLSACVYCAPWVLTHKVKMLHTIHSSPYFELIKPKQKVMALLYKIRKAVPVAISHEISSMIISFYKINYDPELIYNPVDIEKFNVTGKTHSNFNIITVGRLSREKNQKLLIDSVKKLAGNHSEIRLTMLGDGPLRNELENYIKESEMQKFVDIVGYVDNVEDYFVQADVFALSSDCEGLPLVILEAMAAGLPIVSTNVGGVKDIVTDNGILVEANNLDALTNAFEKLMADSDSRNKLGTLSRENVKRFDSAIIAGEYVDLYEKYSNIL